MAVANNERRAKKILNRLIADRKMTEEGGRWLTIATDPFHDTEIAPTGFPDLNSCSTITQCFTYTQSIVAPSNATAEWDAHVVFVPLSRTQGYTTAAGPLTDKPLQQFLMNASTGAMTLYPSSPFPGPSIYGGLNVITSPTNTNPFTSGGSSSVAPNLQFPVCGGQFRLVAAGFEVVNTTPELYKGGAVTVYRCPSQRDNKNAVVYSTLPTTGGYPIVVTAANWIPYTQAAAQLYPSSRTWAAKDGCYCIPTLSRDENPFTAAMPNTPLLVHAPSAGEQVAGTQVPGYSDRSSIESEQVAWQKNTAQLLNFDFSGAIFVGLSSQTTLQVTVKYFVERIPSVSEPDLLVLARNPTPFDPLALELYTRVVQELSTGVPVGENPLGEWFNDVLDLVSEYAPKVGAIFGPEGAALGTAASLAASTAKSKRQSQPPSSPPPLPPRPPRPMPGLQPAQKKKQAGPPKRRRRRPLKRKDSWSR